MIDTVELFGTKKTFVCCRVVLHEKMTHLSFASKGKKEINSRTWNAAHRLIFAQITHHRL